jgi:hypothetical protein
VVGAAASTGASIALLSSLGSCDEERSKDTVMVHVLSPFYSLGAVAIALGNIGIAAGLTVLHALLVVLHHRCTDNVADGATYANMWVGRFHRSMRALRFPTLSLRVWQLMLPGACSAPLCVCSVTTSTWSASKTWARLPTSLLASQPWSQRIASLRGTSW